MTEQDTVGKMQEKRRRRKELTLCARTFLEEYVSLRRGKVSAAGKQESPDVIAQTLRREDSAQQGASSVPLHAQVKACSLYQVVRVGPKSR